MNIHLKYNIIFFKKTIFNSEDMTLNIDIIIQNIIQNLINTLIDYWI